MPNGDENQPCEQEYNKEWCNERHHNINKEFKSVWGAFDSVWNKFRRVDGLMWGMILTLVGNLGGVIAILIKLSMCG